MLIKNKEGVKSTDHTLDSGASLDLQSDGVRKERKKKSERRPGEADGHLLTTSTSEM